MQELRNQVEQIIRRSEVRAVAQAMKSGGRPRIGDVLDYTIDVPGLAKPSRSRSSTYRFSVEAWHLSEAVAAAGFGRKPA